VVAVSPATGGDQVSCGRRLNVLLPFGLSLLLTLLQQAEAAASAELAARLNPVTSRPRYGAPLLVELELDWQGPGLLTGRVEFEISIWDESIAFLVQSDELVLPAGVHRRRIMLPAFVSDPDFCDWSNPGQHDVTLAFVSESRRYKLGQQPVAAPIGGGKEYQTLGIVSASFGPRLPAELWRWFSFKNLEYQQTYDDPREYLGAPVPLPMNAGDLPASPLQYSIFDIVVIPQQAVVELRPRQVEALDRWVQAGGSVCFLLTDVRGLSARQVQVLSRFIKDQNPLTGRGRDGSLQIGDEGILTAHHELGRVVLVRQTGPGNAIDPDSQAWRHALTFLWKVRSEQVSNLVNNAVSIYPASIWRERATSDVYNYLKPDSVRIVSFQAVVAALAVLVLVIGGLDFLVLRWLGWRRLTWLTFPTAVILFSVAGVLVIRHSMVSNDLHRVIEVIDIGHRGQVVRCNRLEYFLAAHSKQVRAEVVQGLWSPVFWFGQAGFQPLHRGTIIATCQGSVPQRYVATQHLGQWMSILYRTLSIGREEIVVAPPQAVLASGQMDLLDHSRVQELVTGQSGASTAIVLHHGIEGIGHANKEQLQLVRSLSELNDEKLVSSVSPSGDTLLEDMALHDSSNPNEGLLVVVQERGDVTVIYRRLFRWGVS
jgi:hypothetical protein